MGGVSSIFQAGWKAEKCSGTSGPSSLNIPVSYTHLDVYKRQLVVGLVLLVALPLVVVFVTRRVVTRPLGELQNFCTEIERSKNFTIQPPRHGEDEVGQTLSLIHI